MDNPVPDIGSKPARQQPGWGDAECVRRVRRQLLASPGLVEPGDVRTVRSALAVVVHRLPPLVTAVREAGHPVIRLSDPMHANTVTTPDGRKTRYLDWIAREVRGFRSAVLSARGIAGGLHLETTPDDVTECVPSPSATERIGDRCTSLCDPRLRPDQAMSVVAAWGA